MIILTPSEQSCKSSTGNGSLSQILNVPECLGTPATVLWCQPSDSVLLWESLACFLHSFHSDHLCLGSLVLQGGTAFFSALGGLLTSMQGIQWWGWWFLSEVSLLLSLLHYYSLGSEADKKNQSWKPKYWKNTWNALEESQCLISDMKNLETLFQLLALESWWQFCK